jgi:hypothetical protein
LLLTRFKRGPDEEGIETVNHDVLTTNALMKKGSRRTEDREFKRGPDEEGIETRLNEPDQGSQLSSFKRGPDEEGIETPPRRPAAVQLSNADLMKKGLRPRPSCRPNKFKRGPDEEGIETLMPHGRSNMMKKGLTLPWG